MPLQSMNSDIMVQHECKDLAGNVTRCLLFLWTCFFYFLMCLGVFCCAGCYHDLENNFLSS